MLGRLNRSLHLPGPERLVALAITTLATMAILTPSAAQASGCQDTWKNTKGGSWFEGANWSTKAPPTSTEEACITEPGTYTVAMTQTGTTGAVTVKSLAVGGSSGTQTLVVSGSNSLNATLTAASGIAVTSAGAIKFTNVENDGNSVTVIAPVTNAGTITTETGVGGSSRVFQGNLTNSGTLAIDTNTTFSGTSAALTNEGTLTVAEGKTLALSSKSSFTNGTGGKIAATGSGEVLAEHETSFTEGAGTTSGTQPVVVDDGALSYAGTGASTIVLRGTSTLSGNTSTGQSLTLQGTNSENVTVTAATGFTNGGTITLTQIENDGNNAQLSITAGTLTNTGTIATEAGSGSGTRTLRGNLTNKGTVAIATTTAFSGASAALTNEGTLTVAEGKTLALSSKSSFTNGTGGKIAATGSGQVLLEPESSFNEGAGTTSGSQPVVVNGGALSYTGTGASTIVVRGSSTLSGSTSSGQSLTLQGTNSENVTVTAATGFTNGGTITLTQIENEGNNALLTISSGTLTNTGTITTEAGGGSGTRTLRGSLTNNGTITIATTTAFSGSGAVLSNAGAVNILTAATLSLPSGQTFSNEAGGSIAATGTGRLEQHAGTFNQGAGKATGTEPLILEADALHYTGTGASTIALRGSSTLSGNVSKGQSLIIQGTNSVNSIATAASGFTNSGTITLTQIENEGNNSTLILEHGGTLLNMGTINAETGPGSGIRTIQGNLTNEKTVSLLAGANLKVTGAYVQSKKGTLKTEIVSATSFGELSVTGSASLGGTLTLTPLKTFTASLGQTYAILSSSARSGTFAKVKGSAIKKSLAGLYYRPTYSATGVTLVVSQAVLTLSTKEGAPGSPVTLTVSTYLPEETVKLTFTDKGKHKTTLPSVQTNASGEFTTEFTIPAGATVGAGVFAASSAGTGKVSVTFTVT
jgi:hypothetical protein